MKKRIVSSALAIMMTTGLLSGCGCSDTNATVTEEPTESVVMSNQEYDETAVLGIDKYETEPESRVYQEYEHLFMVRYNLEDAQYQGSTENLTGTSVPVPDGYEVVSIENFNSLGGKIGTTKTYGFDIWYTNVVPVEVAPVYNETFQAYDFSHPGKVINKENVVDTDKTLNKK